MAAGISRLVRRPAVSRALRLCPAGFRREHGDEMACDFDEARGEAAAAAGGALWTLRLLMASTSPGPSSSSGCARACPLIGCVALVVLARVAAGLASVAATRDVPIPRTASTPRSSAWCCSRRSS